CGEFASGPIVAQTSILYVDLPASELYTLTLHDALPFCDGEFIEGEFGENALDEFGVRTEKGILAPGGIDDDQPPPGAQSERAPRSEEHTSELQSRENLVCRLLLEKK